MLCINHYATGINNSTGKKHSIQAGVVCVVKKLRKKKRQTTGWLKSPFNDANIGTGGQRR